MWIDGAAAVILLDQDERGAEHVAAIDPTASAIACTSRVLPAPSVPHRATVVPSGSTSANAAPRAAVSASRKSLETESASYGVPSRGA